MVISVPFLFPLLIVLLLVLGVMGSFCCSKAPAYYAGTAATLNTCFFPLIFLLVGGLFFPFMLVTSDVCSSLPDLAVSYASRAPETLCGQAGLSYVIVDANDTGVDVNT